MFVLSPQENVALEWMDGGKPDGRMSARMERRVDGKMNE